MKIRLIIALFALVLAGCANLSPEARRQHADSLAAGTGWQKLRIPTDTFILTAYASQHITQANILTVYIEGDGLAWFNRSTPSADPTPRNPVGLELAMRHPEGAAAYLARPCQYVAAKDAMNCSQKYWTGDRFAPEVIETASQAISTLKQRFGATKLVLVGYSGGGAVAALVAARRNDVAQLVTVAGNLDHRAWTAMHHVVALDKSLNPADDGQSLAGIPQRHFVGERDEVVGPVVAESYTARFPPLQRPKIVTVPKFDHVCCWVEQWGSIWNKNQN